MRQYPDHPHAVSYAALLLLFLLGKRTAGGAQTYAIDTDLLFYGDNTEFANPFREGETLLRRLGPRLSRRGASTMRVTVRGGLFGLGRFGSHEFLEHAEP